jgi:quercetin dioxygenase-like cupin family protein
MEPVTHLAELGDTLLATAREADSGRAASTLFASPLLRAVVIALTEGAALAEHNAPPAATLQCLSGRARLWATGRDWVLDAGGYAAIPPERHGVDALTDCVLLLTVAAARAPQPVEVTVDASAPA